MASMSASLQLAVNAAGNLQVFDRIRGELRDLNETSARTAQRLEQLNSASRMMLGAFGVGSLIDISSKVRAMADEYQTLQGRLKLVTASQAEYEQVQTRLIQLADENRQSLEATTKLYTGIAPSLTQMGKSQNDILKIVDTVNKSLVVGGATAEGAKAALLQLTQALASGLLRGDEFNSIMENGTGIAKALADGLGLPIGKLRSLAEEGKLTANVVTAAFETQNKAITEQFNKMPVTIEQSMQRVKNAILLGVGELDAYLGVSAKLTPLLTGLAHNLNTVALAGLGVAAVFAGRLASSTAASMAHSRALIAAEQQVMVARAAAAKQETLIQAQRARDALVDAALQKSTTAAALQAATTRIGSISNVLQAETVAEARRTRMALAAAERYRVTTAAALATAQVEASAALGTARAAEARTALIAAQMRDVAASRAVIAVRGAEATATAAVNTQLAQHRVLLQARDAEAARALAAARTAEAAASAAASQAMARTSGALQSLKSFGAGLAALLGGPLGIALISVIGLSYGLNRLKEAQDEEGKSIRDAHGEYIRYNDITQKAIDLNQEYLTASEKRKEAIKKETAELGKNTQAELDAVKARITSLQSKYSQALQADAANAAPTVDEEGNLQYAPSLAAAYTREIEKQKKILADLEAELNNVNVAQAANDKNTQVATASLKNYTGATNSANAATGQTPAALLGAAAAQKEAQEQAQKHAETLKGLIEDLTKQRIALEHGEAAAKYYTDRLNGLSDAEARLAGSAKQYNDYLAERDRLQRRANELKGGLRTQYAGTLKEKGLEVPVGANFDAVQDVTNQSIKAAEDLKKKLDEAAKAGQNVGVATSASMQLHAKAIQRNAYETLGAVERNAYDVYRSMANASNKAVATASNNVAISTNATLKVNEKVVAEMQRQVQLNAQALAAISKVSSASGVDKTMMQTMAYIESRFNPNAYNASSASGLYQFVDKTAKAYGLTGKQFDPEANTRAYIQLLHDNTKTLAGYAKRYGIELNGVNLYLAHQMGAGGFKDLFNDAAGRGHMSAVTRRNMMGNLPDTLRGSRRDVASTEYIRAWNEKYAQIEAGVVHILGGTKQIASSAANVSTQIGTAAQATNQLATNTQLYQGTLDGAKVTQDQLNGLISDHMQNEMNEVLKKAGEHRAELTLTAKGYRELKLINDEFYPDQVRSMMTEEQQNALIAERKKLSDEQNRIAANGNQRRLYELELEKQGWFDKGETVSLTNQLMENAAKEVEQGLVKQNLQLSMSAAAYRALEWGAKGYNVEQVRTITQLEKQNLLLSTKKQLDQERRSINNNPYQLMSLDLQDNGLSKEEADSKASDKRLIDFDKLKKALKEKAAALKLTTIEQYKAELGIAGYDAAMQKEAATLQATIALLEMEKSLKQERRSINNNPYQLLSLDLQDQGVGKAEADDKASEKRQIDFDKLKKGLREKAAALKLTTIEQYKAELGIAGYDAAMQKEAATLQASIALLEMEKSLKQERRSINNNPYQLLSLDLQDKGLSKPEADDKAAEKRVIDFEKLTKELTKQNKLINLNAQEQYRAQLVEAGHIKSEVEKAAQLNYQNLLLTEQKKLRQEAAQIKAVGLRASYELELTTAGAKPPDIKNLATKRVNNEFQKITQQLQLQRQELTMSAQAYRELQLETDKFQQSQIRYITTQEQANAKLGELKKIGSDVYGKVEEALMQTVMGGKADWSGLVQYMLQEAMRLMVIQPLMKSLFGAGSSDGNWLSSLVGGLIPHAQGGAFSSAGVRFFAQGGVVSSPTAFRFAGSRLGVMGEAGPEAILPLARAANGDLGVRQLSAPAPTIQMAIQPEFLVPPPQPSPISGTMPAINVQVINNGQPVAAEVSQSPNKDGGVDLTIMLDTLELGLAQRMAKGGALQNATASTFALNRAVYR